MIQNKTLGAIIALCLPTVSYEETPERPEGSFPIELKERTIDDAVIDLLMLEGDDADDGQPVRIKQPSFPPANRIEYELAQAMFAKPTPKEEVRRLLAG